ncbi:NAD(P)H-binding protein [Streptomyces glaucescens]|uniref:NmrA family protein n=1 Tax=Streptomyces glaucescens TaxID=1907 RepID=A0A089XE64_STRGA|nr:NAD(P)H-binding protein [Streptomyces glaucescens]AIR99434.1 NmrA family protein [Streptomyces glaucescens]
MSTPGTVLVTGAGGHVGRHVVTGLAERGVPVRAAARDPRRLTVPAGVETAALDLTRPQTLRPALRGVRKVFLYAVPQGVEEFVAAAREAGVEQVVLLSSNTVIEWIGLPVRKPIADMHLAVEEPLAASGIPWTFLRPAHFATNVLMWQWDRMIREDGVVRFPVPESYCDAIHEKDIAAAGVAALTEPGHEGKAYFLTGPEQITQRRQAELIGEAIGRPVRFEEIGLEEARIQLKEVTVDWAMDAVLGYWAASDGVPGPLTGTVEEITGRRPLDFAQWAADHVADFR